MPELFSWAKQKLKMVGTNTPKASVTISPNNEVSFSGSAGYVFLIFMSVFRQRCFRFYLLQFESLIIPGTAVTSDYVGRIIDLQLIMQFDLTNEWGIRLGTNFPLTMTIEFLDNDTTNVDQFATLINHLGL